MTSAISLRPQFLADGSTRMRDLNGSDSTRTGNVPGMDEMIRRFRNIPYNPEDTDRQQCHDLVREWGRMAAGLTCELVPEGRHRSLAVTKLEEWVMWLNKGIAENSDGF